MLETKLLNTNAKVSEKIWIEARYGRNEGKRRPN